MNLKPPGAYWLLIRDVDGRDDEAKDGLRNTLAWTRHLQGTAMNIHRARTFDAVPAMIWTSLPDGRIDSVNQEWIDYTGGGADEAREWEWQSVVHEDDLQELLRRWQSILASGSPGKMMARVRRWDGQYRLIQTLCSPTHDKDGRIIKWCGVGMDVEELARGGKPSQARVAEDALIKARCDLAHVEAVLSVNTLVASIAHEVSQPLSGIVTNASTCLRVLAAGSPDIGLARETARCMLLDGHRMADVIARLRALFVKRVAPAEPVDLNDVIRDVIELQQSDLQKRRAVLRMELAKTLPCVGGDRVQLQQVIVNLLRNATDAMSDVDVRPRQLTIKTEAAEDGRIRFSISDVGVGIGSMDTERPFDLFYTTKSDGMGMGLSICRFVIERFGGQLLAMPNKGPGATFVFFLQQYSGERNFARVLD